MATLAATALASLGKTIMAGVTAAGTAVAGVGAPMSLAPAAAGAAGAAGGGFGAAMASAGSGIIGSLLSTILQGSATAMSVRGASLAAEYEAQSLETRALDADFEARQEEILGMERRSAIRQELSDADGELQTAYAASGVDLTFGTPVQARQRAIAEANRALSTDVATQQQRVGRLNQRRSIYLGQARQRRRAASLAGDQAWMGFATDAVMRG
jgi:hypothetical protein